MIIMTTKLLKFKKGSVWSKQLFGGNLIKYVYKSMLPYR